MKKKILAAGLASTLLALGAGVAQAGAHNVQEVRLGVNDASGVLRHARNSADEVQYIGCWVNAYDNNRIGSVACAARNASGRALVCQNWVDTQHSAQADVVAGIGPDSVVSFTVADGNGCESIRVSNNSSRLGGRSYPVRARRPGPVERARF